MKTTQQTTQSNFNIRNLAVAQIVASDFNPRKTFSEAELAELSESIKKQGVLQPIMVRPKGKKFEIIYGERRYRASILAEQKTIPALVRELTDKEAIEFAITENLQRQDVAPLEEAQAYKHLVEKADYKVADLTERFGKSDSYIRNRLRLNDLIEPLSQLLAEDRISLMVANEFAKCTVEIQEDIFNNHYAEGVYYTWFDKANHEVITSLKNNYTSQLSNYHFDKSECETCRYNSACDVLFAPENAICSNRECLKNKNTSYLISQAQELGERYVGSALVHNTYNYPAEVVEALQNSGEKFIINDAWKYNNVPKTPTEPNYKDYEDEQKFQTAKEEYEREQKEYNNFKSREEAGEVAYYLMVDNNAVSVKCTFVEDDPNQQTPLQKLEDRDKRYLEIKEEKITADVSELRKTMSFSKDFSAEEEQIMYFGMASSLGRQHLVELGIDDYYLSDKTKSELIENLTEKQKTLIKRAYILSTLDGALGNNIKAQYLMKFAKYHVEDEVQKIEKKHQAEYDKRHTAIAKKKATI